MNRTSFFRHFQPPTFILLLFVLMFSASISLTGCGKKDSTNKTSGESISTEFAAVESGEKGETLTDASSEKSSSESSSSEKTSEEKSSAENTSTEKNSTEKTSTEKNSTEKTSTEKNSTEKTSTEKNSTEKTSTEKNSTEKNSTEKNSTEKTSTETTSTQKSTESPDPYKALYAYSNKSEGWGQGVNFNSLNQPSASLNYQKKYGSLQADFIGSSNKKVIWLTMDQGYENGYTSKILDVLKEKNCKVVFYITGSYAQKNPDLIKRMINEGHVIGNHSWSHPSGGMPSLSIEEQMADITKLHEYVQENYHYEMTLFRFPAGIFSEQSLAVTKYLGYRSQFWSFAYKDWDTSSQPDPEESLDKLIERLHPGAIYLLHAVSSTNTEILGDFIDAARAEGYTFELP